MLVASLHAQHISEQTLPCFSCSPSADMPCHEHAAAWCGDACAVLLQARTMGSPLRLGTCTALWRSSSTRWRLTRRCLGWPTTRPAAATSLRCVRSVAFRPAVHMSLCPVACTQVRCRNAPVGCSRHAAIQQRIIPAWYSAFTRRLLEVQSSEVHSCWLVGGL